MMIFEEPSKNPRAGYKKFKPGLKVGSLLLVGGLMVGFGLILWRRAAIVKQDSSSQITHPTVYVPPDVSLQGNGIVQGHLTVNSSPSSKSDVIIYESSGSIARQLTTDNNGYFQANLPVGYYTLQVNPDGQIHNRVVTIVKDSTVVQDINL